MVGKVFLSPGLKCLGGGISYSCLYMLHIHDSVSYKMTVFASRSHTATIRVWSSVMNGIAAFGMKYKHKPYSCLRMLITSIGSISKTFF